MDKSKLFQTFIGSRILIANASLATKCSTKSDITLDISIRLIMKLLAKILGNDYVVDIMR